MNEIRARELLLERYNTHFLGLVHKLIRTVQVPTPACSVSKACGARRTCDKGEMRGPLREKLQNAINRALSDTLDSQASLITVGGRRRNRKKRNKKNGSSGSAWAALQIQANVPPIRSQLDIPPKAKLSPQVTKNKKSKDIKGRLSPTRCRKENFEQDSKPLIVDEVAENSADDFTKVDQENIDPTKMPFELFKRKKNKEKVITEDPILGHKDNDEVTKKDEIIAVGGKGNHTVDDRVVVANDVEKSPEKEEPKKEDAPSTGENAQVAVPAKNQDAPPAKGREGEPEATAEGAAAAEPSKSEKGSLLIDQAPAGTVCCTIL